MTSDKSKKFVSSIIREMDLRLDDYLLDFPEDKEVEKSWEETKGKTAFHQPNKKEIAESKGSMERLQKQP